MAAQSKLEQSVSSVLTDGGGKRSLLVDKIKCGSYTYKQFRSLSEHESKHVPKFCNNAKRKKRRSRRSARRSVSLPRPSSSVTMPPAMKVLRRSRRPPIGPVQVLNPSLLLTGLKQRRQGIDYCRTALPQPGWRPGLKVCFQRLKLCTEWTEFGGLLRS